MDLLRKLGKNNKGFTLVELLIVIGIIGILAAVIVPNVTGLAGAGEAEAASAELATVQAATDTMMAKNGLSSVNQTGATSNMGAFPSGNPLYPNYLRYSATKGTYSCSVTGLVTQETTGY